MRLWQRLGDVSLAQRGALFGWVPVCLAIGIGLYFALKSEPGPLFWLALAMVSGVALVASRVMTLAAGLICAGVGLAKWQEHRVSSPVLGFRYYGPIEGRVVDIDRSASDAVRLTLDQVRLDRMAPARTPDRVRVSVHGDQPRPTPLPGERIMLTGDLSPPSGPAEPGGFDFQRHAYFESLGAVGYTRTPVLRAEAAMPGDWRLWIFTQRMWISRAVQAQMPGEPGAFAAAIMTGDRSGMGQETLRDLRASNLAHLLAISGLHMGLLTGFVFAVVRVLLSLMPAVALRIPVKKCAAVVAMAVGAFYLALSGGNVATERAFIMVSVMFVAVLLDRRALTLRAVAMAAIVVLVMHPIALVGPGFQMSFAATTALVVVFGAMRHMDLSRLPKWTRPVMSVVVSSFVAGMATAPIAAAHFNQIAHYGLIANLLSVPLMGVLVMPSAVLAVVLAPLGLAWIGFGLMELGLRWILLVAQTVSAQDGALSHVVAPDPWVLPVLVLGLLWIILWRGRARWAGVGVAALAFGLWGMTTRPAVLVADSGALLGQMTGAGRALSKERGAGFVAGIWLENDGWPVPQAEAAARVGLDRDGRKVWSQIGPYAVLQTSGKTALSEVKGCDGADVLITNMVDEVARPCLVFDVALLRQTGSLALDLGPRQDLVITTAREISGTRPWNAHAVPRDGLRAVPLTIARAEP